MHPLLGRQLEQQDLEPATPPDAGQWQQFLEQISQFYTEIDQYWSQSVEAADANAPPTIDALQEYKEQLEQAVAERTTKLLAANEQLLREIVERSKVEESLKLTQLSVDNAADAIFWIGPDAEFTYVNKAACHLLGYTQQELLQMYLYDIDSNYPPEIWAAHWRTTQARGSITVESRHKTKDNQLLPVEVTFNYLEFGDEAFNFMFARDITWRRWAVEALNEREERYRQLTDRLQTEKERAEALAQQAEAANRAKSAFLANMSHELRTPLNGILGYTKILRKDKTLTDRHRDDLRVISRSGEHLLTLINNILDLSKIEAGEMELYQTEFYLASFLDEIIEFIQPRAEQKGLAFVYQRSPQLPIGVVGDAERLRQALVNLFDNALKFTRQGQIKFTVDYAPDASDASNLSKIRFEIEDTGIGIPFDQLEAVFEPFQQVWEDQLQAKGQGTGLGLTITQRLLKLMDSDLRMQSVVDKGSKFWFDIELPAARSGMQETVINPEFIIGYRGKQRKILIVDDAKDNRTLLVDLLAPLGFEIQEAVHGQDGLEKALQFKPDIIVLDLMMPVMDGFELARQIRHTPALENSTLIATSASAFKDVPQKSLEAGCDTFIPKPIRLAALLRWLQLHAGIEWRYSGAHGPEDESLAITSLSKTGEADNKEFALLWRHLPPAQAETLFHLAMQGDVQGVITQADGIERLDIKYFPLADRLRNLAKNFEVEAIIELVEKFEGVNE